MACRIRFIWCLCIFLMHLANQATFAEEKGFATVRVKVNGLERIQKQCGNIPDFVMWVRRGSSIDSLRSTNTVNDQEEVEEVKATLSFGSDYYPQTKIVRVPCKVRIENDFKSTAVVQINALKSQYATLPFVQSTPVQFEVLTPELGPMRVVVTCNSRRQESLVFAISHDLRAAIDKKGEMAITLPQEGKWMFGLACCPLQLLSHVSSKLDGNDIEMKGFFMTLDILERRDYELSVTLDEEFVSGFVEIVKAKHIR